MCSLSVVMDYGIQQWPKYTAMPEPMIFGPIPKSEPPGPTKEQFEEFLKLMRAAKRFDEATGQPNCELESKKQIIRDMAKQLGVPVEL